MNPDADEIDALIEEMFEDNFERLRAESGHTLSPQVKAAALQQVQIYWRKLRHIAESVTDTEVKLNLPNQATPHGHRFSIEGVVDIVREQDRTTMYDFKAHDLEFIRANLDLYEAQLNVYAHVWQKLRGERLDETAVISTPVPANVRAAFEHGDKEALTKAMDGWDPVVPITVKPEKVEATIADFALVVDAVEEGKYSPPAASALRKRATSKQSFGRWVCQNCDARFSCRSYREFAQAPRNKYAVGFMPFFDDENDGDTAEERRTAAFEATEPPDEIVGDHD